jgi:signal transduction histidine kinase
MKWYLMVAFLVVSTLLVLVYRNFKKSRRLTRLLKTQKEELEMANAAKDRLFSVVAHDLRSPIGAIGNLVFLANDAMLSNDDEGLRHILNLMGNSNKQVEVLLNNLLHWSVSQRGAFNKNDVEFDFNQLVHEVMAIYRPIAHAKGIELVYNPINESMLIKSDSNCWAVILRNLLNNAIKFTHTSGTVTLALARNGSHLYLTVSDNGIGMAADVVNSLFESPVAESTWGTNREKGMGLGLSLVKEFVDLNNGTIQISSKHGEGSSFVVSIPVVFVHGHLNHTLAHFNQFMVDSGNVSVN